MEIWPCLDSYLYPREQSWWQLLLTTWKCACHVCLLQSEISPVDLWSRAHTYSIQCSHVNNLCLVHLWFFAVNRLCIHFRLWKNCCMPKSIHYSCISKYVCLAICVSCRPLVLNQSCFPQTPVGTQNCCCSCCKVESVSKSVSCSQHAFFT